MGEQNDPATRIHHPAADAVALATITRILDQAHDATALLILSHDVGRVIAGAIIDHDDFGVPCLLANKIQNSLEGRAQTCAFVVGRYHDTDVGRSIQNSSHLISLSFTRSLETDRR